MVKLITFLTLLLSFNIQAKEKTIKLATLNWPPYVFEKGDKKGFAYDLVQRAFEEKGYKVTIDFIPWQRLLKQVKEGKYDGGFPAYFSEERSKIYNVSPSYLDGPLVFAKLKERKIEYTDLNSLKPFTIGVIRGYINEKEFDKADFLTKEAVNNEKQNLQKLLKKRVDLVVVDKLLGINILKGLNKLDKVDFIAKPLANKTLHLLLSLNNIKNQTIMSDFIDGIKALKKSGEYQRIMDGYNK